MKSDELSKLVARLGAEGGTDPLQPKMFIPDLLRLIDVVQAELCSGQLSEREAQEILPLITEYRKNFRALVDRLDTLDAADQERLDAIQGDVTYGVRSFSSDELYKLIARLRAEGGTDPLQMAISIRDILALVDVVQTEQRSGRLSDREAQEILSLITEYHKNLGALLDRFDSLDVADQERLVAIQPESKQVYHDD